MPPSRSGRSGRARLATARATSRSCGGIRSALSVLPFVVDDCHPVGDYRTVTTLPGNTGGKGGRPEKHPRRLVLDAIFYVARGGIAWAQLPRDFPPYQTVYGIFRRWTRAPIWRHLHDALRDLVRTYEGRDSALTAAIVDSQSVRGADTVPRSSRGYDGGKRSRAAYGTLRSTPAVCCWPLSSPQPRSKTATPLSGCWRSSATPLGRVLGRDQVVVRVRCLTQIIEARRWRPAR
ncbi:transposase [Nonomuraea dietziae]|uniref:transposase n=1 Tax=Nonomuraea dietziae TaxID=65515 RepID=UPI0033CE516C